MKEIIDKLSEMIVDYYISNLNEDDDIDVFIDYCNHKLDHIIIEHFDKLSGSKDADLTDDQLCKVYKYVIPFNIIQEEINEIIKENKVLERKGINRYHGIRDKDFY